MQVGENCNHWHEVRVVGSGALRNNLTTIIELSFLVTHFTIFYEIYLMTKHLHRLVRLFKVLHLVFRELYVDSI